MEESNEKVKGSTKKRTRKPKTLEFIGWGSRNLIEFLESLGRDTTNRISESDVTATVMKYVRDINRENPSRKKKSKLVACDDKLRLLFGTQKINLIKVPDLLDKHYVENQKDSFYDYIYNQEDHEQQRLDPSDKVAKPAKQVVPKPKGTFAAIVSDNIKLLYLRKGLVQELAKTPETFESKVVGTFVRIKNPCQLVQVTGVKEGNPIDGYLLQVTNNSYYLKDVTTSALSDDDFSQEECEELHQRIKNGFGKRFTVVDMEEKVRSLHEDVTVHWLARELVLFQRRINQANEKGWRRELSQYLEKQELLNNPEEQSRLLREVPEVVAEELEPVCVDDDGKIENDFIIANREASIEAHRSDEEDQLIQHSKLRDVEEQPTWTASGGDKGLDEDAEEQPANGIKQDKDSITEGEMNTEVTPVTGRVNEPKAQSHPVEIIELSDDDDDDDVEDKDDGNYQQYDPKKVMWFYEFPKGKTRGPFSLTDLKMWNEEYFVEVPDFKVWKIGESKKSAVLLTKLLPHIKAPN